MNTPTKLGFALLLTANLIALLQIHEYVRNNNCDTINRRLDDLVIAINLAGMRDYYDYSIRGNIQFKGTNVHDITISSNFFKMLGTNYYGIELDNQ